jgi:hypothetical protein
MAQDFLSQLFGGQPDYSQFMTPQQSEQSQTNALTSAGLNAAIALLGASGQTNRPISTGQALGSALSAGLGGYQSSFDNQLRQMLAQGKLADIQQNRQLTEQTLAANRLKMEREKQFQDQLAKVFVPTPVQVPMSREQGSQLEMLSRPEFGGDMAVPETMQALQQNLPTAPQLDMTALMQALASTGPEGLSKVATLLQPKVEKEKESFRPMTIEEKKNVGLPTDKPYQISTSGKISDIGIGPQSQVKVTVSPGDTELEKLDAKQVSAISERVNTARSAANTANAINALLVGKGGGELVKIGSTLAQTLGIQSETASANALAQALQVNAATQVRASGSGSTSDLEFKSFLSVFPSLSNSEQGRKLMAEGLQAFANRDALIERKARELFKAKTFNTGDLAAYDATLGPVLDPKKFGDLSKLAPANSTEKPQRRSY